MSQPRPTFHYLGHSTVLCELPNGKRILIDPWLDDNPKCDTKIEDLPGVDAILITHGHFDHIDSAVDVAKHFEPEIVVASMEICTWLTSKGVENCSGMNIGGSQEVCGAKVTQVQAIHSSGIQDGDHIYDGGHASGFVVTLPGYTFYHAGDTALFSDMQLIATLYRPYLAFLPIGDLYTMDPHQAAMACKYLGIREVVPIHWGTFPPLVGRPSELKKELKSLGSRCKVVEIEPGSSY